MRSAQELVWMNPREGIRKKREKLCRICKNRRGLMSRYRLYLCRRCFKDVAERIGFRKYD